MAPSKGAACSFWSSKSFIYVILGAIVLTTVLVWSLSRPAPVIHHQQIELALQTAQSASACRPFDEPNSVYCAVTAIKQLQLVDKLPKSKCTKSALIEQWVSVLSSRPPSWDTHGSLRSIDIVEWDVLQPFISCPGEDRIGYIGDGGKWTCVSLAGNIVASTAKTSKSSKSKTSPCLVYSFGVRTDSSFEDGMHEVFGCELFEFDPSPGLTPPAPRFPDATHFNAWGLRGRDEMFPLLGSKVQGYTLQTIMKKLSHEGRTIDVLKVDIEESEWGVMDDLLSSNEPMPFNQLLIELHFMDGVFNSALVVQLVSRMMEHGYLPFHKELNGFDPKYVTEVSFVSVAWLRELEPACA